MSATKIPLNPPGDQDAPLPGRMAGDSEQYSACSLLRAALRRDERQDKAVRVVAELPDDAWPDETLRQIAQAIRSLWQRKAVVDPTGIVTEAQHLGLLITNLDIGSRIRTLDVSASCDFERDAKHLLEALARRNIHERAYRLHLFLLEHPDASSEELRAFTGGDFVEQELAQVEPEPLLRPADILNAPEPPMPVFEAGPVRGTLALLVAESNRSKSFEALTWAASLATGKTVQRPFAPNEAGPVIYVSYEDNAPVIRWRLARIAETSAGLSGAVKDALESERLQFFCDLPGPLFEATERGIVGPTPVFAELEKVIAKARPIMVVVDPLSEAAILRDENSNSEMGAVAASLSHLAKRQNCVLVLIHHAGKTPNAGQHATRGASSLACRARWIGHLTPDDHEDDLLMLTVVKDSYHKRPNPVTLRKTEAGALIEDVAPRRDPGDVADFIRAWLTDHPGAVVSGGNVQQRKGDGKSLWDDMARTFPWITAKAVEQAVSVGTNSGLLRTESVSRPNGKNIQALRPGTAPATSDEDDHDVPF